MLNVFKKINQNVLIISLLIITEIICCIETEINIPSFPEMLNYFKIGADEIHKIVSYNLLGICISSLFYGPLSDKYGRKASLLGGQIIFTVASIGCSVFLDNFQLVLIFRFMQGIGLSSIFVVGGAIVFDILNKEEAVKAYGYVNAIITIFMSLSPVIGSIINHLLGWKYNFYIVTILSILSTSALLFLLPETLETQNRIPHKVKDVILGYAQILKNQRALAILTINAFAFSSYIVFLTNMSIIFINNLHVGESVYGIYQAFVTGSFTVASIITSSIIKKFGYNTTRNYSGVIQFLGTLLLLIFAIFTPKSSPLFVAAKIIENAAYIIFLNILYCDYMEMFEDIKGLAASLCTATRLFTSTIILSATGLIFKGRMLEIAIVCFVLILINTVIYMLINNKIRLSLNK